MTNSNVASHKQEKANAALLRSGLLGNAKRSLTLITLIWMSVLAAHIYLRFPWGGKTITHSKWCCAYLFFPALLAMTFTIIRACTSSLENPNKALSRKIKAIYKTSDQTGAVQSAGLALQNSASSTNKVLVIILLTLSIACIGVAGWLDKATDQSSIKGLSIAECSLLAGIIITLIAFTFSAYLAGEGKEIAQQPDFKILHFIAVGETQTNSGRG